MTKIFRLVDFNKEETTKPKSETKVAGLALRMKERPSMIDYVLQIEKQWERYALAMDTQEKEQRLNAILKQLSFTLKSKARAAGAHWNNSRLSAADFESIFYEETWRLCDSYNHYSEFYFYETFLLALKRRGIDVVRRRTKTQQGAFELEVRRLNEEAADYIADTHTDVEGDTINRLFVTQILNDATLTGQERDLLRIKYENPNLSKQELARAAGLKHHQEVTRIFERVKNKLSAFQ